MIPLFPNSAAVASEGKNRCQPPAIRIRMVLGKRLAGSRSFHALVGWEQSTPSYLHAMGFGQPVFQRTCCQ